MTDLNNILFGIASNFAPWIFLLVDVVKRTNFMVGDHIAAFCRSNVQNVKVDYLNSIQIKCRV